MDDKTPVVSFAAYESILTIYERHVRRLLVALLVSVILLFASNVAWLYFFSQFEFTGAEEYTDVFQEGDRFNNANLGEQGDVFYGAEDTEIP